MKQSNVKHPLLKRKRIGKSNTENAKIYEEYIKNIRLFNMWETSKNQEKGSKCLNLKMYNIKPLNK